MPATQSHRCISTLENTWNICALEIFNTSLTHEEIAFTHPHMYSFLLPINRDKISEHENDK